MTLKGAKNIKRERIDTYDAWRGIAAIKIVCGHMSYLASAVHPFWKGFWHRFLKHSGCTTFFFLCSGFFLDYTWKDRSFGPYMKGKLKRIYPLTLIVFLLALIVDVALSNDVVSEGVVKYSPLWFFNIAANVLLIKAFIPVKATYYSFHGPSWYISVLIWFYVICYPIVKRLNADVSTPEGAAIRKKTLKLVKWCCGLAYLLQLILCIVFRINDWPSLYITHVNPVFRIFGEGFAGILFCEYQYVIQDKLKAVLNRLHMSVTALEITAVVLFLLDFVLHYYIKLYIYVSWLQIIPMGLIMIAFRSGQGAVSKVLKKRPFMFLGEISFELYLTHAFVYEGLPVAVGFVSRSMGDWLIGHAGTRFLITLVLCVIFAWIVHVVLEWGYKRAFPTKQ